MPSRSDSTPGCGGVPRRSPRSSGSSPTRSPGTTPAGAAACDGRPFPLSPTRHGQRRGTARVSGSWARPGHGRSTDSENPRATATDSDTPGKRPRCGSGPRTPAWCGGNLRPRHQSTTEGNLSQSDKPLPDNLSLLQLSALSILHYHWEQCLGLLLALTAVQQCPRSRTMPQASVR